MTTSTSNRQFDQLAEAQEAQRERMVSAALRGGISAPEPPVTSLGSPGYYDEAEPVEKERIDGPAYGRSAAEEDIWRERYMAPEAVLRREEEREALEELDELRVMALERDAIEEPRLSGAPVRRDVRADFYWQARG